MSPGNRMEAMLKNALPKDRQEMLETALRMAEPRVLLRNSKDSVFTDLFSEADNQQELYKALTGETRSREDFRTITMENYLVGEIHNDLGFLVGNELIVLCEAQSTWNENIVYRILCYLVLGWRRLQREQSWDVFAKRRIPLPKPKLYVIYTGDEEPPSEWLRLSELYFDGDHEFLEVSVKCVSHGKNPNDILSQYKRFTQIVDETVKEEGYRREAAEIIVQRCLQENVLVEYINRRGNLEMIDMLSSVFNVEEAQRVHVNTLLMEQAEQKDREKQDALEAKDREIAAKDREMLETIVDMCSDMGLSADSTVQQLMKRGKLDQSAAEAFLHSYTVLTS